MKKAMAFIFIGMVASSCTSVKQIGNLNMISTRNVDPKMEYVRLTTYSGASKGELKSTKAETVEDAINQTVK